MGKKYIVKIIGDGAGSMGYPTIEPYTEPDLERVKKTAHDDGYSEGYQAGRGDLNRVLSDVESDVEQVRKEAYDKGYKKCLSEHDFDSPCVSCDEYQRGLADAKCGYENGFENGMIVIWDVARRICAMDSPTRDKIFGEVITTNIFEHYSASEVIEKLKAYERKQEEIKVGDVVRLKTAPEIEIWVTDISDDDGGRLSGLALKTVGDNCEIGDTYAYREIHQFERTGRHYNVAAVLEKMRGEQDE